jgi:hypothetical protein
MFIILLEGTSDTLAKAITLCGVCKSFNTVLGVHSLSDLIIWAKFHCVIWKASTKYRIFMAGWAPQRKLKLSAYFYYK